LIAIAIETAVSDLLKASNIEKIVAVGFREKGA
jgi:hypothetical protein